MLILTRRGAGRRIPERRPGETLHIGENITVTVPAVKAGQVRIGVEAPKEIRVDREEIRRRKDAEREAPSWR